MAVEVRDALENRQLTNDNCDYQYNLLSAVASLTLIYIK